MAFSREPTNSTAAYHHQNTPWTSPVPYLFGGLAALLALIAFAFLLLICSHWKLSGRCSDGNGSSSAGETAHARESGCSETLKPVSAVFEERFLVVMAGEDKPTFLATPVTTRSSSSAENKRSCGGKGREKAVDTAGMVELTIE